MSGLRKMPGSSPSDRERGLALVLVVWIIALLGLQVSLFNATVRDGAALATNEAAIARGEALVRAGLETAVARILSRDERMRWSASGGSRSIEYAGARVSIVIADENVRLDINKAEGPLLISMLRSLGDRNLPAAALADRILDWRDPDGDRRPNGAEDPDYRRAGLPYGAADRPFLDPTELGRILGFPAELARRMQPLITVYGREGKLNASKASDDLVRGLPNIPPHILEQYIELRTRGGEYARQAESLLQPAAAFLSGQQSAVYRITIDVQSEDRWAVGHGEAVIMVSIDAGAPYRVLSWSHGIGMPRQGSGK